MVNTGDKKCCYHGMVKRWKSVWRLEECSELWLSRFEIFMLIMGHDLLINFRDLYSMCFFLFFWWYPCCMLLDLIFMLEDMCQAPGGNKLLYNMFVC